MFGDECVKVMVGVEMQSMKKGVVGKEVRGQLQPRPQRVCADDRVNGPCRIYWKLWVCRQKISSGGDQVRNGD